MMQRHPVVAPHFQFPTYHSAHPKSQLAQHEIVEISSDEDEYAEDGQPESSKRVTKLSSNIKRAVIVEENDNGYPNDWHKNLDIYSQFPDPTRMKRQKLDHVDNTDQYGAPSDEGSLTSFAEFYGQRFAPATKDDDQFTQVNISFNGLDHGDNRATLAFRPSMSSQVAADNTQTTEHTQADSHFLPIFVTTSQGKMRLEAPPYYDDPKLEARMYRGPGYEKFPVVLGSVSEHSDICDEWDRVQAMRSTRQALRRAHRAEFARFINDTIDADSSDDNCDNTAEPADKVIELECLHKIREVLPDIQREFALEKIQDHIQAHRCNIDSDIQIQPNTADIVSDILELSEYPKQEKPKQAVVPAADGTGVTIEWRKGDKESKTYLIDAVGLLATQFDYIPTHFINRTILNLKSLFDAYLYIHDLDMNYHNLPVRDRPYRRSHNPRVSLEKKYMAKEPDARSKAEWSDLVNELQAAKQQNERDRLRKEKEKEEKAFEEANLQDHKASGNIVECQCCFDDEVPINRAVSCENKDMHWFCFACVLGLAENQVGSMKYEMSCMDQSGCKASLSRDGITRAISRRLFEKLAFYQQQSEITAACLEGLEQCPFCDFKAICDPIEITSVFQCQNPDCQRVSCRKCHEDSHLPKSCEEVKNDKRVSARHQVEEARSEAMMRSCPRCKVKIVKEVGCNKMRCGMCGCVMCYVCKADISQRRDGGYGHFNETGAKCVLYDKDFDRHEFEANEAEKEAIKRVQAENADIDEQQLQIETGAAQKKVVPKKAELRPDWIPDIHVHHRHARANNEAFAAALRQHRARFEEMQRVLRVREQHAVRPGPVVDNLQRAEPARPVQPQRPEPSPASLHGALHALHRRLHPLPDRPNLAPPRLPGVQPGQIQGARVQGPAIPRVPVPRPAQPQNHQLYRMDPPWVRTAALPNPNHDMNVWHVEADATPNPVTARVHGRGAEEVLGLNRFDPMFVDGLPPARTYPNPNQQAPQRTYYDGGNFIDNLFAPFQPQDLNHNQLNTIDRPGRPAFEYAFGAPPNNGNVNQNQDIHTYMMGGLEPMPVNDHNLPPNSPLFDLRF